MTKEERLIVSAYTGILMTQFGEFHEFAEVKLGRPIWTHEFASEILMNKLKKSVEDDFLNLCKD